MSWSVNLHNKKGFTFLYFYIGRTGWPGDWFAIELHIGTVRKGIYYYKPLWP